VDDDVREACVRSIGRMLSESAEAAYEHDHPGGLPRTPDSGALADALVKLSVFAAANAERFSSIDVNPFIVKESGAVAVDALIVPAGAE